MRMMVLLIVLFTLNVSTAAEDEMPNGELFPCRAAITMSADELELAANRNSVLELLRTPAEQGGWTVLQTVMSKRGELDGWAVVVNNKLEAQGAGSGTFVVNYISSSNEGDQSMNRTRLFTEAEKVIELVTSLWAHFSKVRNSSAPLVLDPDIYWFAVFSRDQGSLCVEAWSPDPGSDATALVSFSEALRDYACDEISEKELWALIEKAILNRED